MEINTVLISYPMEAREENISINTSQDNKLLKEEIINQAIMFHSQGNISEATKYYQHFINKGYKDHRVFSNYGLTLQSIGKLKEAIIYSQSN